ncbi:MAG: MBOAT family protein [Flavobacteriales bacterium]|nr:MBOAT family protein [Flavobacteriales bacterium]MBK6944649.1 MBOAT family protein [Flavobacteriales bacterium]MBK7241203.1 MBOAT family protein [Flavobacteriales bacterium]MBK7295644.1 MBOAT family protein [Flavobacteriales bacterium]MBK9534304.1 MBOAT family protein [Flavobacteriales bacterium]
MLFNSIDFALFLPIVFLLYWWVGGNSQRRRNVIVLVASYVFYGWWDWRFLGLIAFSTLLDYSLGVALGNTDDERKRKYLLWTSIAINLGFLGFFKYYNFFADSFADAFTLFGSEFTTSRLNIILPVGISFYTFQTLSYTIDVYKRQLEPSRQPIAFAAYVSFFPQLVAGPIERAVNLLPQFSTLRKFDRSMAYDGVRQMLWGLFKKVVVADNCAEIVNPIFAAHHMHDGSTLFMAAILFAFQIYGDFSGYSDIAIGSARLFGFDLMRNFAYPYFSRDIAEFWRRWHISLSTWFRDYVYIPLGGSRLGKALNVRNVLIIFVVSGFWHGANWTFVFWGLINGLLFLPLLLLGKNRAMTNTVAEGRMLPTALELWQMVSTFAITCFAWIFFRAASMQQAYDVLGSIASRTLFNAPAIASKRMLAFAVLGIMVTLALEWISREKQYGLQLDHVRSRPVRYALYYGVIAVIMLGAPLSGGEFIYFQF